MVRLLSFFLFFSFFFFFCAAVSTNAKSRAALVWVAGGVLRINGLEHLLPRVSASGYLLPFPLHSLLVQHLEERMEVQKSLSYSLLV